MVEHGTLTDTVERTPKRPALAPHLYVVMDANTPRGASQRHSLSALDEVRLGRGETRLVARAPDGRRLELTFDDRWMSAQHARLVRVANRWQLDDLGSRNGVRVNGRPVPRAELVDGDVVELGRTFLLYREGQRAGLLDVVAAPDARTLIPELEVAYTQLGSMARASVPVMVVGETGVGKELAARLAHDLSGRRGAFVPINCGALPSELVASQLFGHQKGAFTGASDDRLGFVRAAHQGTLFLDEVGELPIAAQPMLLRVLQEREVTPVGATRALPVDVQLVSATHRDLAGLEDNERFRSDLLARLSGFTFELPPLRERREDLGLLVSALMAKLGVPRLTFSPDAVRAFCSHAWPKNIRELERALQVGAALAQDDVLELEHLPPQLLTAAPPAKALQAEEEAVLQQLVAALELHRGNLSAVARAMGKARVQVQRWVKRFGLNPDRYR